METKINATLDQAIGIIRSGEPEQAGPLLAGLVRKNPKDAAAWLLLAGYAPDLERQRFCLERSLALAPQNAAARQLLQALQGEQLIGLSELINALDAVKSPEKADFISLSCPNCGGTLQVTEEKARYVCPHCGQEHLLRVRAGLEPALEKLQGVQQGVERAADELALQRLGDDMERLQQEAQANKRFFGRGGQILMTGVFVLVIYFVVVSFNPLLYLGAFLAALGLFYFYYGLKNSVRLRSAIRAKSEEQKHLRQPY